MIITKLEKLSKAKIRVYVDEYDSFIMYKNDIENFSLEEGKEITNEEYERLLLDILLPRAKQKALAVLKFMDRSEQELRKKLEADLYPNSIINNVISYVTEYGYLNDKRFAEAYVRIRKKQKSKLVLKMELLNKGIDKIMIEEILSKEYQSEEEDPEITAIKKAIAKKAVDPSALTGEEKQKLIAGLYRKGFEFEKIRHVLEQLPDETADIYNL